MVDVSDQLSPNYSLLYDVVLYYYKSAIIMELSVVEIVAYSDPSLSVEVHSE